MVKLMLSAVCMIITGFSTQGFGQEIDDSIRSTTDSIKSELQQDAQLKQVQGQPSDAAKQKSCEKIGSNLEKIRHYKTDTQRDLDQGSCSNPPTTNIAFCKYHKETMEIIDRELEKSQPVWDRECKRPA